MTSQDDFRFTSPHNRNAEKGVVNFFKIGDNSGAQVRQEKMKPSNSGGFFALTALEVEMQPIHQPTKQDERARLRELAEQRQSETPEHQDPDWMAALWLRKAVLS